MKYISIILLLTLSTVLMAQNLEGTQWFIPGIFTHSLEDTDSISLELVDTSAEMFPYGVTISFGVDGKFRNSYSAPCGSDCFPSVTGTYEMIDDMHLRLLVLRFDQVGECKQIHERRKVDLGVYELVSTSETSLSLVHRAVD